MRMSSQIMMQDPPCRKSRQQMLRLVRVFVLGRLLP